MCQCPVSCCRPVYPVVVSCSVQPAGACLAGWPLTTCLSCQCLACLLAACVYPAGVCLSALPLVVLSLAVLLLIILPLAVCLSAYRCLSVFPSSPIYHLITVVSVAGWPRFGVSFAGYSYVCKCARSLSREIVKQCFHNPFYVHLSTARNSFLSVLSLLLLYCSSTAYLSSCYSRLIYVLLPTSHVYPTINPYCSRLTSVGSLVSDLTQITPRSLVVTRRFKYLHYLRDFWVILGEVLPITLVIRNPGFLRPYPPGPIYLYIGS